MYLVIIAASIPTLKPMALARSKFTSRGTSSSFSWRRLFSRSSTNRSHTEEYKLPSQPLSPLPNKQPIDIYTEMLRRGNDDSVGGVSSGNRPGLDGIRKTTELTIGYADRLPASEEVHGNTQREFEMV